MLYCLEDDLARINPDFEKALGKLELFIVHAVNFNKSTALANIVFPASSYAEKNGTMVNFEGRIQRLRPCSCNRRT